MKCFDFGEGFVARFRDLQGIAKVCRNMQKYCKGSFCAGKSLKLLDFLATHYISLR